MVNKPLIRPAISGGGTLGGGRLNSHENGGFLQPNMLWVSNENRAPGFMAGQRTPPNVPPPRIRPY